MTHVSWRAFLIGAVNISFLHGYPKKKEMVKALTTKGKSQEIPLPFCRAAIVVGPEREGIQKKPSVRSPLKFE